MLFANISYKNDPKQSEKGLLKKQALSDQMRLIQMISPRQLSSFFF
jgi:hypothetical protein